MTALFDLDGVLSREDTMGALVRRALRGHPFRAIRCAALIAQALLTPSTGLARPALHRAAVAIAMQDVDDQQYDALVAEVSAHLARKPGNVPTAARMTFEACQDQGVPIHIVTASERRMAQAFLDAAGLTHTALHASEIQLSPNFSFTTHNVGPAKRDAVVDLDLTAATLWTDSASDTPLAELVPHTVLVNGRRSDHAGLSRTRTHLVTERW